MLGVTITLKVCVCGVVEAEDVVTVTGCVPGVLKPVVIVNAPEKFGFPLMEVGEKEMPATVLSGVTVTVSVKPVNSERDTGT